MQQFQDKTLKCQDCGNDFSWTANEQDFYAQKGFQNPPKRCADCRRKHKMEQGGGGHGGGFSRNGGGQRQSFEITCSNCGKKDSVPFQPRGDKPVLCGDCFRQQRQSA